MPIFGHPNTHTCWIGRQGPLPTCFNRCSTRQPEWSVEPGRLIAACPKCFTPSYNGWTFLSVSSINSRVTVHRCLQNKAPQYLMDCCTLTSDISSHYFLRSANGYQLMVPRHSCSTFGRQAFSIVGPMNSHPDSLQDRDRCTTSFSSALKTHLFAAQRDDWRIRGTVPYLLSR